jgi:hypothetical protein
MSYTGQSTPENPSVLLVVVIKTCATHLPATLEFLEFVGCLPFPHDAELALANGRLNAIAAARPAELSYLDTRGPPLDPEEM